jgi:hypothetical protein
MSEAETSEQQGHPEKPTREIVDRRLSQPDGKVRSGNQSFNIGCIEDVEKRAKCNNRRKQLI